jgi:hypothetical protein
MGSSIDDVASSVQGLILGDDPYSASNQLSIPQEAIQGLHQLISAITSRAQSVKALIDNANSSSSPSIGKVCSLHKQIKRLTEITLNLRIMTCVQSSALWFWRHQSTSSVICFASIHVSVQFAMASLPCFPYPHMVCLVPGPAADTPDTATTVSPHYSPTSS